MDFLFVLMGFRSVETIPARRSVYHDLNLERTLGETQSVGDSYHHPKQTIEHHRYPRDMDFTGCQ